MNFLSSSRSVLWFQVLALAGVQGAITLTWIIYDLYLKDLLVALGLAPQLGATLLIVENAIAAITEPILGGLSQQRRQWVGRGLPWISFGAILASACFIAIPAVVIWGQSVSKWILPFTAVAWAIAMTVFRAPALALLGYYAKPSALPQAASIVTLTTGLIGTCRPLVTPFLLSLGPAFAFTLGSLVLLGTTSLLRLFHPPVPAEPESAPEPAPLALPLLAGLWITGTFVAWSTRFFFATLPKVVDSYTHFPLSGSEFMLGFGILSVFTTLLAGRIATQWGNTLAMLMGVGTTMVLLPFIASVPLVMLWGGAIVMMAIAFPLLSNGTVPLALGVVPPSQGGIAVGCFFGGFTGGMALFNGFLLPHQPQISLFSQGLMGAVSLALVGGCIYLLSSFSASIPPEDEP